MGRNLTEDSLEGPWLTHNLWDKLEKRRILEKIVYCSNSKCSDSDRRVLWFPEEFLHDTVIESGVCMCDVVWAFNNYVF